MRIQLSTEPYTPGRLTNGAIELASVNSSGPMDQFSKASGEVTRSTAQDDSATHLGIPTKENGYRASATVMGSIPMPMVQRIRVSGLKITSRALERKYGSTARRTLGSFTMA